MGPWQRPPLLPGPVGCSLVWPQVWGVPCSCRCKGAFLSWPQLGPTGPEKAARDSPVSAQRLGLRDHQGGQVFPQSPSASVPEL